MQSKSKQSQAKHCKATLHCSLYILASRLQLAMCSASLSHACSRHRPSPCELSWCPLAAPSTSQQAVLNNLQRRSGPRTISCSTRAHSLFLAAAMAPESATLKNSAAQPAPAQPGIESGVFIPPPPAMADTGSMPLPPPAETPLALPPTLLPPPHSKPMHLESKSPPLYMPHMWRCPL